MSKDPVTAIFDRFAWVAWSVIVVTLFVVAFDGGFEVRAPSNGWALLDAITTSLVMFAVVALAISRWKLRRCGSMWLRASGWLQLLGYTAISGRFLYFEQAGDIPVHPISVAAIGVLAASAIVSQLALWMHMFDGAHDRSGAIRQ